MRSRRGPALRTFSSLLQHVSAHGRIVSKLETEINEKLQECHIKLLQAGVDQKESEKEAKRKETFASLQRIFPGLCRNVVMSFCSV
jgi:structural maintenance of chromosome 1